MKFKIDMEIDATPAEMREMMGLPNVSGMQDRIIEKMEGKINDISDSADPSKVMSLFMPDSTYLTNFWQKMMIMPGSKTEKG